MNIEPIPNTQMLLGITGYPVAPAAGFEFKPFD
jgi:hypothetical protein